MLRLSLAFDWSWIPRPCIGDRRCARLFMGGFGLRKESAGGRLSLSCDGDWILERGYPFPAVTS
jgi:hypothetical protein